MIINLVRERGRNVYFQFSFALHKGNPSFADNE